MFFTELYEKSSPAEKEELLKTLFMHTDSAFCAGARLQYYKTKLKYMGENVKIGKGVKIINPEYVSLGDDVTIMDDVTIIARGEGGIEIDAGTKLCERVYLDTELTGTGYIKIGRRVYIGTGTTMFGHNGLEIGDFSLIAQNVTLTPYSHIFDNPCEIIRGQGGHSEKVTIGKDCYIGMGVTIMYSGNIGDGSVVGCGALVVKPIPPYTVAVGAPAKPIKKRG